MRKILKKNFFIGRIEMGQIISFSGWKILFPVFEMHFEVLLKNQNHFVNFLGVKAPLGLVRVSQSVTKERV